MQGPAGGLSQQAAEAEGSLTPEARGRVGAALTTTGRVGTARRPGSGKRDEKVQRAVNQWWNPRKRETPAPTWWMWAGQQRTTTLLPGGRLQHGAVPAVLGGHGESLRRTRGEAAGEELGTALVDRSMVNVGTLPGSPSPLASQAGGGQARRRLLTLGGDGVPVVVGGRESRPHASHGRGHGEGGQRVRSGGTGRPGGRR
jgi:hypothetical protein